MNKIFEKTTIYAMSITYDQKCRQGRYSLFVIIMKEIVDLNQNASMLIIFFRIIAAILPEATQI